MAEQSFGIELRAGADVSEFRRELKNAQGDVEALAKVIENFKRQVGDVPTGKNVLVTLSGKEALSGELKVVEDSLNGVDDSIKETVRQLKKLTGAEKRSTTALSQKISFLKQQQGRLDTTSRGYRTLQKGIDAYTTALKNAKGIQKGSIADLSDQADRLEKLANITALGSEKQREYANAAKQIRDKIKGTVNPLGKFFSVLNRIATVQAGFTAFAAIAGTFTGSLNKFIGQQKALEGFELALRNVGLSTTEVNDRLQDAARISAELGAPLEQVEKSFKRMVPALENVGVNAQDSGRFLEGIAARTQTLGLNTEQTGRFMEAFAQVLSKGKLQSEELNQQISELDGAFRGQLADALGVTTQELEDMLKNGEITSEVFVEAFNNMENGADELRRRLEEGNGTIQQFQNLINLVDVTNIRNIGKQIEPGIKAFLSIDLAVKEFIKTVSESEVGKFLANVFNQVALGAADFVKAVTEVSKVVIGLLEPVAAFINVGGGLIRVVTSLGLAFVTLGTSMAVTDLMNKVTTSMGLMSLATKRLNIEIRYFTRFGLAGVFGRLAKAVTAFTTKALIPLLAKLAPFVLLLGVAKLTMDEYAKMQEKTVKPAQDLAAEFQEITNELKDIAQAAREAREEIENLPPPPKGFMDILFGNDDTLEQINQMFELTKLENILKTLTNSTEEFKDELKDLGVLSDKGFRVLAKDINLSGQEATDIKDKIEDVIAVQQNRLKVLQKEAKAINTSTEAGKALAASNSEIQFTLGGNIVNLKQAVIELNKVIEARKKEEGVIKKTTTTLKELTDKLKLEQESRDLAMLQLETDLMVRFGDSMIEASNKAITLASAREKLAKMTLEGLEADLRAQKQRTGLTPEQEEDREAQIKALTGKILEAQSAYEKANDELAAAVQQDLVDMLGQISQTADGYVDLANTISAQSGRIASSINSNLSAVRNLVNTVANAQKEGATPEEREQIDRKRFEMLGRINDLEEVIAEGRLRTEFRIANLQNKMMQARLREQAMLAAREGDAASATALNLQLQAAKALGAEQSNILDLELRRLYLEGRVKDEMLLQEALQSEALNNIKNQEDREKTIASRLGLQRTTLEDINRILNQIENKEAPEVVEIDEAAINAATRGYDIQVQAAGALASRLEEVRGNIVESNQAGNQLATAFENIGSMLGNVNTEATAFSDSMRDTLGYINDIIARLGSSNPARFMGGPVEAGQTYKVNDGGLGREAFMNKFGNIKMLPAGSNLNWTAPSSGTIIPAKIVKAMQKNAEINSKISSKSSNKSPNVSVAASIAADGVSGNLAKQLSSAMTGSSSNRIVNNVTIQSQNPVHEASDLMTNVARMRIRNRRSL